mmetsp:Transcript_36290/g.86230  ORF Transcript_36290/g.86230 Transcript_36290/m.86230 type:complete len:204 (-) Transcript_36290:53-664(-)
MRCEGKGGCGKDDRPLSGCGWMLKTAQRGKNWFWSGGAPRRRRLAPTDAVSEPPRTRTSSCPFGLSSASIRSPTRVGRPCRSLLSPRSALSMKPPATAPAVCCDSALRRGATGRGGANPAATRSDAAITINGTTARSALPAPRFCGRRTCSGIVPRHRLLTGGLGKPGERGEALAPLSRCSLFPITDGSGAGPVDALGAGRLA